VPTSVYPEEPANEQSILLSQPDAPTYNVQADPILATVSPIAETNTYSSVQEPVAPVQIPLGIQEEIQQQQQSILSNFDSPAPAVDDAPQQVAVFFSAPNQQQPIAAPTLEYLPPYAAERDDNRQTIRQPDQQVDGPRSDTSYGSRLTQRQPEEARPISPPPSDYRPDWDFGPTVLQEQQSAEVIQQVPEEEVYLVSQPASLPTISSILQELPEQQLEEDDIRQQQVEQQRREPTQFLQNERQPIQQDVELIRPQRPRPLIIQREPEEVFAKEQPSSPSSSNSLGISRPFRPRPVIIQEPPSEFFLKNFPEVAAPEGSDVPLDEQAAIREALFELKKETRSKA